MNNNRQLDLTFRKRRYRKKRFMLVIVILKKIGANTIHELVDDLFNIEEILGKDDELIVVTKDRANDTIIKLLRHLYNTEGSIYKCL